MIFFFTFIFYISIKFDNKDFIMIVLEYEKLNTKFDNDKCYQNVFIIMRILIFL